MGLIGGLVTDLLGGSSSSAVIATTTGAALAVTSKTTAAATTAAGKTDATSSSTTKDKDTSTSISTSGSASSISVQSSSATSATVAKSTVTSASATNSAMSFTSVSSSSITTGSAITSSDSSTISQSESTGDATASTTSTSDSASPTESASSTSVRNSSSNVTSTITASASASASASSTSANAAALNAASRDTSGSNILDPNNKLFPLGIVVVILGGLFVIVATTVLFIRLFGWNRKRRNLRGAIPSFIESDPSFEPKSFETITTNIAGTGTGTGTGTRGYQPMQSNISLPSTSIDQQGGYIIDEPTARPQRAQYYPQAHRGITGNPYENAFFPRTPNGGGAEGMLSPTQQPQQDMGSPVPSFHTGRTAYEIQNPTVGYPVPSQPQSQSHARGYEPTRSKTKYSTTSSKSSGRTGSAGSRVLGANPSQAYGMGMSFSAYPQKEHRRSGSGESFKSTSSGKSGRSGRSDGSSGQGHRQGHRKLGKEQPWTMNVQGV